MKSWLAGVVACFLFIACAAAQVPGILSYQGRVSVDAVNFTGTGQFKFALVDPSGTVTYWSHDGTSVSGAEPTSAIERNVQNGLFDVLLWDVGISNMTAIPPAVFGNSSVWLRVWFSDGTGPFELLTPDTRIAAVGYALVAEGVRAGGVTSGMLAEGAVQGSHIADGSITAGKLAPGVGGGGGAVPSGGMVFSADPEAEALAAAGLVPTGRNELGGERWVSRSPSQFLRGREGAVVLWTGTEVLVWGGFDPQNYTTLLADGGRFNPQTNTWRSLSSLGAPSPRLKATAVWTGSQMIVWGGHDNSGVNGTPIELATGGIYTPATDTWAPLPATGALPAARYGHTAVWTGTEMLVWGGENSSGFPPDGGRFDPASGTWLPMSGGHGLEGRIGHSAVWTGSEMIVWGGMVTRPNGIGGFADWTLGDGARYAPSTNTWQPLPATPGFSAFDHVAVWTGSRMLVHGGTIDALFLVINNGGVSYDPSTNTWTAIQPLGQSWSNLRGVWSGAELIVIGSTILSNTPGVARYNPATNTWQGASAPVGGQSSSSDYEAVWTGSELLLCGGGTTSILGSRYNPATDVWGTLPAADFGSPPTRTGHTTIWTGSEAIIYGGTSSLGVTVNVSGGARYSISENRWNDLPAENAPSPRVSHTAVWTGTEMIVWGGRFNSAPLGDGARYHPGLNTWTPVSSVGAPSPRFSHTAVWTGTHMIVHGGADPASLGDTYLYSPDTDTWTTASAAPLQPRFYHTATWTAGEMIVWGGYDTVINILGIQAFSSGARYNPTTDTWVLLPPLPREAGRYFHTATWTGRDLLIWGGIGPQADASNTGLRFRPSTITWSNLTTEGAPSARLGHSAVWSGSDLLVWGGLAAGIPVADGARYSPGADEWTPLTATNAPSARSLHTAVWAGTRMFLFGGNNATTAFNDLKLLYPARTLFLYQQP